MSAIRRLQTAATVFREPAIESFARVMRQRAFRRNSQRLFHQRAHQRKIDNCVCESRRRAAESAERIDGAKDSLAQRQTIALMPRVEHFRLEQREIHVGWAFRRATFAGKTVAQRSVQFGGTEWMM